MSFADIKDSYRQVQLIRMGHPCEIWGVRRERDHARLAMKLVPAGSHHTREEVAQLRHEFSIGSKLDHENIARMYEFASTAIGSFIIMELCEFPSLKQRVQAGVEQFAYLLDTILVQAGRGLAHMHERGFLHRDIKPDNYLVSDEGLVKLIDFNLAQKKKTGLAKLLGGKNKVQGTMSYMSPEQIRGQAVDERADVYCFGCMMFELASGKLPFTGTSANELLTKHLRAERPSLEPLNANVTRDFSALVRRAMARDPKDRPAAMNELLDLLGSTPVFRVRPQPPEKAPSPADEGQ